MKQSKKKTPESPETTEIENGWQVVPYRPQPLLPLPVQTPHPAAAPSISGILVNFIHGLQPRTLPGGGRISYAADELMSNGGSENIDEMMLNMHQYQIIPSNADAADTMFEFQAPILIGISDNSHSFVITIRPVGDRAQIIIANGTDFEVEKAAIYHLLSWLIQATGWIIRIYLSIAIIC